jgi:RNA-binding protein 5/10
MAAPREWDSGKEQWAQQHTQWDDGSAKMRAREDDEYAGDGKRRKHNDGVRSVSICPVGRSVADDGVQSWDAGEGEGPTDWSLNKPKKRLVPSEPSEHVIFLGLDTDFNETDVRASPALACHKA